MRGQGGDTQMKIELVSDEPLDWWWVLQHDPYLWTLLGGLLVSGLLFCHLSCRHRSLDQKTINGKGEAFTK